MNIWAFNGATDKNSKEKVYESFKNGISRFGWSSKDEHDLRSDGSKFNSKQQFLLRIKKNDWIVHINTPVYGKCIAGKVEKEYDFDEGIRLSPERIDFRHCFKIEKNTIIEFNRNDKNILPTVNLKPRQRYHRIRAEKDFLQSIENLKNKKVNLKADETKEIHHLKNKTENCLDEITKLIHSTHKSKNLEKFMANVFSKLPNVVEVIENGCGWKSDNGADLIVIVKAVIGNLEFENKVVVQIKSFQGSHYDLQAVKQIKNAIETYSADAGIIITTAKDTPELNDEIQKIAAEIDIPIDLIAGENVAKFVIKYASELVFKLDSE